MLEYYFDSFVKEIAIFPQCQLWADHPLSMVFVHTHGAVVSWRARDPAEVNQETGPSLEASSALGNRPSVSVALNPLRFVMENGWLVFHQSPCGSHTI